MRDRPILLIAIAQTLVWASIYYSFPALLLHWESALGWSRADLTAALTLALIVSAFASPLSGRLIDLGLGPLVMTISTVISGVCLLLLSQVETLGQFYAIWSVIGLCMAGALYEPCFALITRARGIEAKRGIVFVTLVAGFAGSVSFPVAHAIANRFDWQGAVLFFGVITIVIVAPIMWIGTQAVEQGGKGRRIGTTHLLSGEQSFWRTRVFWSLALAFSLTALLHGVTLHHLLPILSERRVHPEVAVMTISFIGPMQVAGRLAMMAAERRVTNHGMAISCFLLLGISVAVLTVAGTSPPLLVGFVILFGGAYGMVSIIRPVIALELLGERQFGAKSGGLAVFYLVGSASAPFLGALIWSFGGYELVLPLLILIAIVGLGLYLIARKSGT